MESKRRRSNDNSEATRRCVQKPVLEIGEEVYSAWWPDVERQEAPTWWPGIITSVTVKKEEDYGYGPLRLYSIEFKDGDSLNDVQDTFVISHKEYLIETKSQKNKHEGIKNVCDSTSNDAWARLMGWYEVKVHGKTESFPLLSEALQAYRQLKKPRKLALQPDSSSGKSCETSYADDDKSNVSNLVCFRCNKRFISRAGLSYHLDRNVCQDALPGDPELTCPRCSKWFKSAKGLEYHMERKVCESRALDKNVSSPDSDHNDDSVDDNDTITSKTVSKGGDKDMNKTTAGRDATTNNISVAKPRDTDANAKQSSSEEKQCDANKNVFKPTPNIIKLNKEQSKCTTFPIGCDVWLNLQLDANGSITTYEQGKVIGTQLNVSNGTGEFLYHVSYLKDGRQTSNDMLDETKLVFAENTPVLHSLSELSGAILCCERIDSSTALLAKNESRFLYTLKLCDMSRSGAYHVIRNVPSAQIKYDG